MKCVFVCVGRLGGCWTQRCIYFVLSPSWTAELKIAFLIEKGNLLSEPKGHRKSQKVFVLKTSFKFKEHERIIHVFSPVQEVIVLFAVICFFYF